RFSRDWSSDVCSSDLTSASFPLARSVNVPGIGTTRYLRNSVKATVDALTGDVALYAADEADPILATYRRIFPGLFRPLHEMDPRSEERRVGTECSAEG